MTEDVPAATILVALGLSRRLIPDKLLRSMPDQFGVSQHSLRGQIAEEIVHGF
jgi:hypothetical protein